MKKFSTCARLMAFVFGMGSAAVWAGPEHIEDPDAGSALSSAQPVYKCHNLAHIFGELDFQRSGVDMEDMSLFRVDDAVKFSARTDGVYGSFADFDSQLWQIPGSAKVRLTFRVF